LVDGSTEALGQGQSFDESGEFSGSPRGDERLSGPFYIGRASFRMGMVEGGVVSGAMGGHTPAKGIGYLPIDPDDDDGEWAVSPIRDPGKEEADLPTGAPEDLSWEEEEPTAVFVEPHPYPASATSSRSVAAVLAVAGFVGGALVLSSSGLMPRLPWASIRRAAAPPPPGAPSDEHPRSAFVPMSISVELPNPLATPAPRWPDGTPPDSLAPPSVSPVLSCERELSAPAATTTGVATPDGPRVSAVMVQRKSPRRRQRTPPPTGSTAAAGWVDPWAE
jgi:hypothetical protein